MSSKRDTILNAAERLLATYGVDGIRLRDIAAEAGVSIGVIQHHFISRDAVVEEMLKTANDRRIREWTAQLDGVEDSRTRLRLLLAGGLSSRERCIVWTECCSAASRHAFLRPLVTATNNAWRTWVVDALERGRDDGSFKLASPPETTARMLVALVDGLMMETAGGDDSMSVERAAELLLATAAPQVGLKEL